MANIYTNYICSISYLTSSLPHLIPICLSLDYSDFGGVDYDCLFVCIHHWSHCQCPNVFSSYRRVVPTSIAATTLQLNLLSKRVGICSREWERAWHLLTRLLRSTKLFLFVHKTFHTNFGNYWFICSPVQCSSSFHSSTIE